MIFNCLTTVKINRRVYCVENLAISDKVTTPEAGEI
jgi:hypothetical protein